MNNIRIYFNYLFFFLNFWRTWVLFVGSLIPLIWTSGDVSSGFQSQSGFCLIRTWQRCTCYTFPEIHLWCYTCWPLGGQHGCQADLFYLLSLLIIAIIFYNWWKESCNGHVTVLFYMPWNIWHDFQQGF